MAIPKLDYEPPSRVPRTSAGRYAMATVVALIASALVFLVATVLISIPFSHGRADVELFSLAVGFILAALTARSVFRSLTAPVIDVRNLKLDDVDRGELEALRPLLGEPPTDGDEPSTPR